MPTSKIWTRLLTVMGAASVALAVGSVAVAQEGTATDQKAIAEGVFVRDSAVALEKIPLAQRLERMNEWGKAADVLQEVLEKYPDRVIEVQSNAVAQSVRYTSVATAVRQRISKWPADGLAAYRARFEAPARSLLDATDPADVPGLRKVYSTYFNTEAGRTAAMRLVDLYFRGGDFRAAADVTEQMLDWHPLITDERPGLLYRAALFAHLLNDPDRATERLDALQKNHAEATAQVRGQDVVLTKSLQQELATPAPAEHKITGESWPMFGGDPSRSRVSTSAGRTGARLYTIPVAQRDPSAVPPDQRPMYEALANTERREGTTLGIMPVVDNGELFFQDGQRIYGVSLEGGVPLAGWAQTYAGANNGAYVAADCPPMPSGQQLSVTVTPNEVLAIMGFTDRVGPGGGFQPRSNALSRVVCLDRATGQVKWVTQPQQLPAGQGALQDLIFSGSPLVIGDSVHFLGRGGKGAQFEDCYLITLDLATGKHKWSTYIASANAQNMGMFGARNVATATDTTSHIAYASGRLFVLTNLGVVAAVDAYSGAIDWLSIYDRNVEPGRRVRGAFGGGVQRVDPVRPYTFNPVIVQGDRVFVLPVDSDDLLIYNAVSGEIEKSIRGTHLASPDSGKAEMLVGVHGDRLIVASEFQLLCLSWSRYDPAQFTPTNAKMIYWPAKFAASGEMVNRIRGRPFLTTDTVVVSAGRRLDLFDMRSGRRLQGYPANNGVWAEDEGAGNVVIAGEHVILAGDRAVSVYTDLQLARGRLDAAVAAAPQDPAPWIKYAEVMFVAGETTETLNRLDEAARLVGATPDATAGPRATPERDRLFNTALSFAQKTEARKTPEARAVAQQFYDRAAVAAVTPSHHVNLRTSRARGAAEAGEWADVVRHYQEILSDPATRAVMLTDDRGPTQAAEVAEREIAQVLTKHGRDLYRAHDQAADTALAEARASNDPDRLIAVAQRYPNATVAPTALTTAATAFEQAGNHRMATTTLRQVAYKYPTAADAAGGLEAMARNYLAIPNRTEVAISRLSYGVRKLSDPRLRQDLKLPDGRTIAADTSFADAIKTLREHASRTTDVPLPDFGLPGREWRSKNRGRSPFVADAERPVIPNVTALLVPPADHVRYDRIVTWSPETGVATFAVGQTKPLAAAADMTDRPLEVAWLSEGLLVTTPARVSLLNADTLATVWTTTLAQLPDVEYVAPQGRPQQPAPAPVAMSEEAMIIQNRRMQMVNNRPARGDLLLAAKAVPGPEQLALVRVTDDRILLTTTTGRLFAVDRGDGKLAWQARLLDGLPVDRVVANGDFTVARTVTEFDVQLTVFETHAGQLLTRRAFATSTASVPVNFALAADGTLVFALPDRLCAKDLHEPGEQLTWEVASQQPGRRIFQRATHPDHMKIIDGRIAILSDENAQIGGNHEPTLFVRLHSLETGRSIPLTDSKGPQANRAAAAAAGLPLQTQSRGWHTRLAAQGPHLYILSPQKLQAYDLDRLEPTWFTADGQPNLSGPLFFNDWVVLLDLAPTVNGIGSPSCVVQVYSRTPTPSASESGKLTYLPTIKDEAGITTWQPVQGGLYYLAADRELRLLKPIEAAD